MENLEYMKRMWRASLTSASVLSESEATNALPCDPAAGAAWLRANVPPSGSVAGVPVFLWADVLRAMERNARVPTSPRADVPQPSQADMEYLPTAAAAKLASVSTKTIRTWIQQRRLTPYRAGRLLRVRRDELLALLRTDAAMPQAPDAVADRLLERLRAA